MEEIHVIARLLTDYSYLRHAPLYAETHRRASSAEHRCRGDYVSFARVPAADGSCFDLATSTTGNQQSGSPYRASAVCPCAADKRPPVANGHAHRPTDGVDDDRSGARLCVAQLDTMNNVRLCSSECIAYEPLS